MVGLLLLFIFCILEFELRALHLLTLEPYFQPEIKSQMLEGYTERHLIDSQGHRTVNSILPYPVHV
jgi:hypothetical protein